MIPKDEIERKDFSCALPNLSLKLAAVGEALHGNWERVDPVDKDALYGFGNIIDDIKSDIDTIDNALNRGDEKPQETQESKE
jgi:hypothetical protein